jgi:hypothetical protein
MDDDDDDDDFEYSVERDKTSMHYVLLSLEKLCWQKAEDLDDDKQWGDAALALSKAARALQ